MHLEKLGLQHQLLLSEKFAALEIVLSEYKFANLFLFRQIHQYEVVFANKIYVKGKTRDGITYYMPTQEVDENDFFELEKEVDESITFFPIPEKWLHHFAEPKFLRSYKEADSDYLYSVEKMRTYPGRHLNGQRNFVRQFQKLYQSQSEPLTSFNVDIALTAINKHYTKQGNVYKECLEALQLHQELGLNGMIYFVDGAPSAVLIGEPLTSEVYLLHFAEADKSIKGIYSYIYQHYAKNLPNHYLRLNMEQDLGIEGLKKAKMSFAPEKLELKWRIQARY